MGSRKYSTPVDIWSVGCILAEMANGRPLITGTSESDQLDRIFRTFGTPTIQEYPGMVDLPEYNPQNMARYPPPKNAMASLVPTLDDAGVDLFTRMVQYDPNRRITAQEALNHPFFYNIMGNSSRRNGHSNHS